MGEVETSTSPPFTYGSNADYLEIIDQKAIVNLRQFWAIIDQRMHYDNRQIRATKRRNFLAIILMRLWR
jgi:hypothetical protein